jgi:hypothetical protein
MHKIGDAYKMYSGPSSLLHTITAEDMVAGNRKEVV